ncbi:MAG: CDP-alcohol phosphatidyltransferase family protein, partial [Humibacillus sp.]|nr:CDP-alcohol phosphatidyltransferase family protein [Humibacillus sp.]
MPAALVGSPRTRALQGTSSGGTLVVLTAPGGPGGPGGEGGTGEDLADQYGLALRRSSATGADALELLAAVCRESDDGCVVVVAGDLVVSPVALLDVLDARDLTCAAVLDGAGVADRHDAPSAVRVSEAGRRVVSVASAHHTVTTPTGYAAGVLRVRGADRARLADALDDAAVTARAAGGWHDTDADLALLVAVRSGLAVAAVPLAHQEVRRGEFLVPGAPGSPWRQRLRSASRGNDGVFSTLAVRPLSRRLTAYGLGRDWSPNVVTAVSLALGLLACAAVATGWWWAWLLGAVLLQASLVVDCVDGEIARFTRRSNPLGGWLDAVSDRVKEFSMVAALAWVSARRGSDLWWLAVLVLAVLAVRHVEDHAYTTRRRARLVGRPGWPEHPRLGALDEAGDGGPPEASTEVAPPPGATARRNRAVRQVLHLPIAERYLVISLGLLTMSPAVVLWALGLASLVALAWTQAGRLVKALTGRDGFDPHHPDPVLADLCDLAVLPRPSG